MRCLTIRQPWASLIAVGAKQIETRGWATRHRGRIAIHAGVNQHHIGIDFWERNWHAKSMHKALIEGGYAPHPGFPPFAAPKDDELRPVPLGAIVATAELVDCVPMVHTTQPRNGHCLVVGIGGHMVLHGAATEPSRDVSDQNPFGDYRPGRFAWLLDDINPTTERCPWCWGDGGWGDGSADQCWCCLDVGTCGPVPAKGRQGVWEWRADT